MAYRVFSHVSIGEAGKSPLWISQCLVLFMSSESNLDSTIANVSLPRDEVYSQAIFTIVADAAEDSTSGFLGPGARKVRKTSVVKCDLSSQSDKPHSPSVVHVRQRGDLAFQLPYHDFLPDVSWWSDIRFREEDPPQSKLSTRAWAFQERLLSPRTLHFGSSEMAWECRGICSCECSATNKRTSRVKSLLKGSIALVPSPAHDSLSAENVLRSLDKAWQRDIVEEYTRLDLTRDTDRLSALAGIAVRGSTLRLGDQYMG